MKKTPKNQLEIDFVGKKREDAKIIPINIAKKREVVNQILKRQNNLYSTTH